MLEVAVLRAELFAFYIFSLRLDTSFHSLPLVPLFVNQYDTADTALARASFPDVCLGMLSAGRGALRSSIVCLVHGRGLRPATKPTAHPAWVTLGASALPVGVLCRWAAQPSHGDPGEGQQEHSEKEARRSSKMYCCSGCGESSYAACCRSSMATVRNERRQQQTQSKVIPEGSWDNTPSTFPKNSFLTWLKFPCYPNAVRIFSLCCTEFIFLHLAFSFPNELSISYANLKKQTSSPAYGNLLLLAI